MNQAVRAVLPHGKEHHWDIYLNDVTFALNSLRNKRNGFSANKMVFGSELNTPLSVLIDNGKSYDTKEIKHPGKEVYELKKRIKNIYRKVRENADIDFMYAKRQHDRNLHMPLFKAGSYCYVLVECPSHKFSIRWRGPLRVNKVINDHLCVVQLTPEKEKVVNIRKMKPYEENKYSRKVLKEREESGKRKEISREVSASKRSSDSDTDTADSSDDDGKVIGRILKKNKIETCYLDSGKDAVAGCSILKRAKK